MLTDLLPGDKTDDIHRMPRQVRTGPAGMLDEDIGNPLVAHGVPLIHDKPKIENDAVEDPLTLKRWCKKYDACRSCGKTDKPHMARGLCSKTSCYWKYKELPDDKLPSELPKL